MKMSKLGYFSEFLLFPPLILAATLLALHKASAPHALLWLLVFGGGLIGWTLIEYLLHRFFFHHAPVLKRVHERHHNSPLELIGTPAWASALIALVTAALACAVLGFPIGTAATAGLAAGYLWYVFVHYAAHHWRPRRGSYLYGARLRHARHHHQSHDGNFGVTTALWDHVFSTALEEHRRNSQ
jgi:sterol desaturase/sphingolipid hydroxylase (fatty acid hydroxylase superfamily)